jgi:aspartyl-tRNA(Asn)/glutamyl-tRNA(Gln) amidotransferase subunit A
MSAAAHTLSLAQAADAVRSGRASSLELTQEALARAKRLNPALNAFVRINEDDAIAAARAADASKHPSNGHLHGVPLAHKDMFYRAGQVSTCGSKLRANWQAPVTATVLERLDAAGALQIGTLNMTEFAYGPTGQNAYLGDCRNPWSTEHLTGGSSSGSAASVAARIVYGALGSDTAGSVRNPAGLCGLVGMKTTFGRVSRFGAMPLSATLDTVGCLTRTVEDNALMLAAIAGHDPRDASTAPRANPDYVAAARLGYSQGESAALKGLRIGRPVLADDGASATTGFFMRDMHADVARTMEAAFKTYEALGATIVDIAAPRMDALNAAGFAVTWGDVLSLHGAWVREHAHDYTPQTRGRLEVTLAANAADYQDALRLRPRAVREFCEAVFTQCDVFLAPVISVPTPKISDVDVSGGPNMMRILNELTRLFRPINYLGLPALALPGEPLPSGLPCGVQLVGRPFAEAQLYRVGAGFEAATQFSQRMPALAQ